MNVNQPAGLHAQHNAGSPAAQSDRDRAVEQHNSQAPIYALPVGPVSHACEHLSAGELINLSVSARFLAPAPRATLERIKAVNAIIEQADLVNDVQGTVFTASLDIILSLPAEHQAAPLRTLGEKMADVFEQRLDALDSADEFTAAFIAFMRQVSTMPEQQIRTSFDDLFASAVLPEDGMPQAIQSIANAITEAPARYHASLLKNLSILIARVSDEEVRTVVNQFLGRVANLPFAERAEALSELHQTIVGMPTNEMRRATAAAAASLIDVGGASPAAVQVSCKLRAASLDFFTVWQGQDDQSEDWQRVNQKLQQIDALPAHADRSKALDGFLSTMVDGMEKSFEALPFDVMQGVAIHDQQRATFVAPLLEAMVTRLPILDEHTRTRCMKSLVDMNSMVDAASCMRELPKLLGLMQTLEGPQMRPLLRELTRQCLIGLSNEQIEGAISQLLQASHHLPPQQQIEHAKSIAEQVIGTSGLFSNRLRENLQLAELALRDHSSNIDINHRSKYIAEIDQLLEYENSSEYGSEHGSEYDSENEFSDETQSLPGSPSNKRMRRD